MLTLKGVPLKNLLKMLAEHHKADVKGECENFGSSLDHEMFSARPSQQKA
jgi:hypothetical protein